MIQHIRSYAKKLKTRYLLLLLPFTFILQKLVNEELDKMYARSLFPVPFYKGQ
ncbi:hypothetical protein [Aneurinibacillus uraniidurans]|uniref:hypothetical protein n=1 Tax=Aneurinibacillus uraniidurans TaxID=2966586 RepID=UPI002349AEBF|nr:hypothetical protein [Aneurinibacillus sp. B1]WCN38665.1 hypothetical protein PO771_04485 [Aneurinibacillus sp. B1]